MRLDDDRSDGLPEQGDSPFPPPCGTSRRGRLSWPGGRESNHGVFTDILAFAERVLPRASDLWVQASLDYRQRLQQLFFPEGIAYDGIRFNRTAATAPLFNYLAPDQSAEEVLVSRIFAS
jgi:hypothetical protein